MSAHNIAKLLTAETHWHWQEQRLSPCKHQLFTCSSSVVALLPCLLCTLVPHLHPCLLQSLSQATDDSTELRASFQAERAEMLEEAGVLRARVAQLQALQAVGARELEAAAARMEGGFHCLLLLIEGDGNGCSTTVTELVL